MLLIKNANLLSMAKVSYEKCDILINGNTISKIGHISENSLDGIEVIDAEGRLVTPGLIDAHCHVGMCEEGVKEEGEDSNEATDPITPEIRGIDGIKPYDESFKNALNTGITTVITGPGSANVIGGTFCALKTYGKTVLDMCIKEEIAMKMALGENPKMKFGSGNRRPMTRMGSAALMREALMRAKIYHDKKLQYQADLSAGKDGKEPEFNLKMESLARVFDGMPVKIHAHQQDDIVTALRIIEEFNLNATIDHCTEGYMIADVLKERHQRCIIGPTLGSKSKIELRNKTFGAAKVLFENDIEFAIMTDHPVILLENTLLQASQFVKYGVPPEIVLKALTLNAAKMVGLDNELGSIEEGKVADIVIWSGDPFHYMTIAQTVIVNGKVVVQH